MFGRQDVGAFGHEVHTAEDDVLGLWMSGRLLGQLEGVTGRVGELDDLVTLVVVAEDVEPVAERLLGNTSALHETGIAGWGQITRALHTAFGVRIGTVTEQQQR